jgi:hypothetical protein
MNSSDLESTATQIIFPQEYSNRNAELLYYIQSIYLPFNAEKMVIEFPASKIYANTNY